MVEYKPNSHKSKEERIPERKVEKVVSGVVKPKKKSDIQKFADIFISEDISNVKSYILLEVLIPAIKKAIFDIVTNGIDMILYGEGRTRNKSTIASKVSYQRYYDRTMVDEQRRNYSNSSARNGFDYDELIFPTRGDAEAVLDAMNEIISQYGVVSIMDLYDLANVSTDNYQLNRYGWTDISGCKVIRVRDGYILNLPRPLPIN